jgi:hypothetical protein
LAGDTELEGASFTVTYLVIVDEDVIVVVGLTCAGTLVAADCPLPWPPAAPDDAAAATVEERDLVT